MQIATKMRNSTENGNYCCNLFVNKVFQKERERERERNIFAEKGSLMETN